MSLLMPESTLPIRRRSDPFLAKRHSAHVVWTYRRDTNAALREHLHPHSTLLPRILRQDVTKTINKPMDALMAASENLDEDLETLTAHFWDIFFRFFSSPTNSISVDQAARLVTHSDFSDMDTSPCMLAELDECRNRESYLDFFYQSNSPCTAISDIQEPISDRYRYVPILFLKSNCLRIS